jgi:hypothetical protein
MACPPVAALVLVEIVDVAVQGLLEVLTSQD